MYKESSERRTGLAESTMKESGAFFGIFSLKDTERFRYWTADPHEPKAGLWGPERRAVILRLWNSEAA